MTLKVLSLLASAALAQGFPSAHWRSTVTVEGAPPGQALQSAEIWLSLGRMRIEEQGKGSEKTNILAYEDRVYVWVEGQSTGMKLTPVLAARSGRPSHDYVRRIEEIRSRGRKTGDETVDGQPCDVFEYEDPQQGTGTYWLATRLQNFPLKAIVQRKLPLPYRAEANRAVKIAYRNTDVRIPGKTPEARFAVPAAVQFQDATEILMPGRAPRR